ncbi:hypothetical protein SAMN02745218_02447 [Desulfofundulus australicus DSM 11792]|uniref:Uncharacterized protein n=1 Tax=Desulfofundulus australicus DSM 11792 TaxID=1121425 RepID=A0A1M4Z6R9_9FIRM|nr:hypothetical protein SAMN02745218_01517 [Desulfofundulus australicus DSM 11792]SHF50602.1 hypothetical protein SAMN02745218_02447 [Desulfofundulus australicus DSM 11792]
MDVAGQEGAFSPGRAGDHRYGDTRHNLKTFPVRVTFFVAVCITLPDHCQEVSQKRAFSPGGRISSGVGGPFASRLLRCGLFERNSHASVAEKGVGNGSPGKQQLKLTCDRSGYASCFHPGCWCEHCFANFAPKSQYWLWRKWGGPETARRNAVKWPTKARKRPGRYDYLSRSTPRLSGPFLRYSSGQR